MTQNESWEDHLNETIQQDVRDDILDGFSDEDDDELLNFVDGHEM